MQIRWDENKRKQILRERKIDIVEARHIFKQRLRLNQKNDDPEQWRVIGWLDGRLVTLIYEVREDHEGSYFWLVTIWKATNAEEKLFSEN